MFQNLSKIACNRLQKELVEWQVNPPTGFKHKVTDNLQRYQILLNPHPKYYRFRSSIIPLHSFALFLSGRWVVEVTGAPGTLYANETYQLQVDFPENYPMEAPQVPLLSLSYTKLTFDLYHVLVFTDVIDGFTGDILASGSAASPYLQ